VLTEDKWDEIDAMFEHTPKKSLRRLVQETEVSEKSTLSASKFLK
jgi:hypothetical protein